MNSISKHLLAVAGAIVGGAVGYLGVGWVSQQGFYAMMLPGGLLGLGASLGKSRSYVIAIACGIAALGLGYYAESQFFPFIADESVEYFMNHLGDLQPISHIMIVLGGFLGFWLPFRVAQFENKVAKL